MRKDDISRLEEHLLAAIPWRKAHSFAHPLLKLLIHSWWSALCIHWMFQGLLNMDRTERLLKIGFDLLLSFIIWIFLRLAIVEYGAILVALFMAHSINFLLNGQIHIVLLHYGIKKYNQRGVLHYTNDLRQRMNRNQSILASGVWGGFARGENEEYPDIDIRVIRKPGILNGMSASWFMMKERSRAFFKRFPLDAFLSDSWQHINKLRSDETPIILYDPNGLIKNRYRSACEWHSVYSDAARSLLK